MREHCRRQLPGSSDVHLEVPRTVSTVGDNERGRHPLFHSLLFMAAVYYALSFVCVGEAVSFVRDRIINIATSAVGPFKGFFTSTILFSNVLISQQGCQVAVFTAIFMENGRISTKAAAEKRKWPKAVFGNFCLKVAANSLNLPENGRIHQKFYRPPNSSPKTGVK